MSWSIRSNWSSFKLDKSIGISNLCNNSSDLHVRWLLFCWSAFDVIGDWTRKWTYNDYNFFFFFKLHEESISCVLIISMHANGCHRSYCISLKSILLVACNQHWTNYYFALIGHLLNSYSAHSIDNVNARAKLFLHYICNACMVYAWSMLFCAFTWLQFTHPSSVYRWTCLLI